MQRWAGRRTDRVRRSPTVRAVLSEPDPRLFLDSFARLARELLERSAGLQHTLTTAASVDREAAEMLAEIRRQRHAGHSRIAAGLPARRALSPEVEERHAADIVYLLMSPEVYRILTAERGWDRPDRPCPTGKKNHVGTRHTFAPAPRRPVRVAPRLMHIGTVEVPAPKVNVMRRSALQNLAMVLMLTVTVLRLGFAVMGHHSAANNSLPVQVNQCINCPDGFTAPAGATPICVPSFEAVAVPPPVSILPTSPLGTPACR